jgi:hypothetical protein
MTAFRQNFSLPRPSPCARFTAHGSVAPQTSSQINTLFTAVNRSSESQGPSSVRAADNAQDSSRLFLAPSAANFTHTIMPAHYVTVTSGGIWAYHSRLLQGDPTVEVDEKRAIDISSARSEESSMSAAAHNQPTTPDTRQSNLPSTRGDSPPAVASSSRAQATVLRTSWPSRLLVRTPQPTILRGLKA